MRRKMRGVPNLAAGVSFGNVDESWRAPLHRKLGIETYVHMQAILGDPNGVRGNKRNQTFAHWYRYPVTLAKVWG